MSTSIPRKIANGAPGLNRLPLKGQDEATTHHHHNQSANLFVPISEMGLTGYGTAAPQQQIPQKSKLGSKGTVSGSVLTDVQRFHHSQAAMIAQYGSARQPASKVPKSSGGQPGYKASGLDGGRPHGSVN